MAQSVWWSFRRSRDQAGGGRHVVDLSGNWEVVTTMLLHRSEWRVRAVEQLLIGSARVCQRHRSLQVAPLGPTLSEYVGDVQSACVLLPTEILTKRPLLGFDVSVDGKAAFVVPRRSTAEMEADYISLLAEQEGVLPDLLTQQYLAAICEFTPSPWQRFREGRILFKERALRAYLRQGLRFAPELADASKTVRWGRELQAGLGVVEDRVVDWLRQRLPALAGRTARVSRSPRLPQPVPREVFKGLRNDALHIGRMLRTALGEGRQPLSSADNPLLAAPLLSEQSAITSLRDLADALSGLRRFVDALSAANGNQPQRSLALRTLAEFGRRWQCFVWCEVPLNRPFIVTTQHEVPVRLRWLRNWAKQPVALADAGSNHVTLSTGDANVEIASVELRGVDNERLEHTLANGVRQSRERFAIYTSEPERDSRGVVRFRLKVPLGIVVASSAIHTITWVAVAITGLLISRHTLTAADLAVLLLPTTFAASLLLTRERNSLARRIQWMSRSGTALATLILWVLAGWAYFAGHVTVAA